MLSFDYVKRRTGTFATCIADFDIPLTRAVSDAVSVPVIASGGAGKPEHFAEAITEGHASAVLAASVFHFGQFTIDEAKSAMQVANVPVRRLT